VTDDNDRYLQKAMDTIEKFGVMIQYVGGDPDGSPPFAYTVGMAAMEEPELIIFGLDPEVSTSVLNAMVIDSGEDDDFRAKGVVTGKGWRPGPSGRVFGNDVPARLFAVTPENSATYLRISNALFAVTEPVPALQVVYPDKQRRWPWTDGSKVAGQPMLWSES
jgi:hypothetical protein